MKQAVILVGGKGSRLGAYLGDRPKPFLDMGGVPFIDFLIAHAKCQGMRSVILLAGYGADWVKNHYHCSVTGINVSICTEPEPLGTAGALLTARAQLEDAFLLLNGDSILAGNWTALYPLLQDDVAIAVAARNVEDTARYGAIEAKAGRITKFAEKMHTGRGDVNAGIYAIRRDKVLPLIAGACSLESDIIPLLVREKAVTVVPLEGYFTDIGLPETLEQARNDLRDKLKRPAVIFDRDNTLVEDRGYTHKTNDLVWKDGAVKAVRALNDQGFGVFVATNQAGIARGYYAESDMVKFHTAMQDDLFAAGAHIDGFFHCPHHPEGAIVDLAVACGCRKPGTGMLETIFSQHNLDHSASVMIGDDAKDVACGKAFGIRAYQYRDGSLYDLCLTHGLIK